MNKEIPIIFQLVLIAMFIGCQTNPNPCSLSQEVLNDLNRLDSIINLPETIERERQWMMHNYKEPSIFDAKNETYRFLWSSSFDGTEVYRIEKNENEYVAIKKCLPTTLIQLEF